ncbi:PREDICTED: uncharacterized protein LOC108375509 isoform X3 [Rhagoletis zephyria]|uniref:uncharacterized protein LOC108375509 isoform X3 n=1 Tax=Rhagoletis zephyria TaxID=28612 RepID=UPI0008118BD1|nr:PREDICTED: uncharacterized protein LOC108375509 isoform X3 [Rhagoletis zephyria]
MEVDDAAMVSGDTPVGHAASPRWLAENGGARTASHIGRRNDTKATAIADNVGDPPELEPPPEQNTGEIHSDDKNEDDSLYSESALKLEVSGTEDEDSRDGGASVSQTLTASSADKEMMKINAINVSLKRKRYEIRSSGSNECLLGFDEKSGEAKLVKAEFASFSKESEENVVHESSDNSPRPSKKIKHKSGESSPSLASPKSQQSPKISQVDTINIEKKSKKEELSLEQRSEHIVADTEEIESKTEADPQISSLSNSGTQVGNSVSKKPLSAQDDFYKKPFEYGWKRELVWRANMESSKDKADVYFITPGGKKLRTRGDIIPLLEGDLTIDNFSFVREPLGVGSEFELVRSAKPSGRASASATALAAAPTPTNIGKRISKPKGPKGASPPPQGWTPTRALKVNNALLSGNASSRYTSHGTPGTPPSSRHASSSSGASHKSAKTKKHVNDIENDLKQINESIRNNRKTSAASLDAPVLAHSIPAAQTTVDQSNKVFATNFFANVSFAYDALLCILKYLKIHERPRAASVCKLWHLAAKDTSLWQTVRMKNSRVSSWAGFAAALRRGETKHLDLRKMLVSSTRGEEMWQDFSEHIGTVCSLEIIDLCRCSARIVESLFQSNKNLRILNAVAINDDSISLEHIGMLTRLEELRLRTCEPGVITGNLQSLQALVKLNQLSLTSVRELGSKGVEVIGELVNLRSLELGECGDFDPTFAKVVLPKLKNLRRLRLENGQETNCCTLEILDAVAQLEELSQLELVNFDIKSGFDEKLQLCTNIRKLLIIPTYISQSATTNHIVLNAVQQVASTLKVFTWGVTVELLRVTALYVDQCEESTKKEKHHFDECIPVLKPVPGAPAADDEDEDDEERENARDESVLSDVPQIEILPLDKVESILGDNLPKTKFTIVKVPYHATCKQQLVE